MVLYVTFVELEERATKEEEEEDNAEEDEEEVKRGYSDTHARGLSKFDKVLAGAAMVAGRADGADWVRRLREAALKDEEGKALDGAIATIRSFS